MLQPLSMSAPRRLWQNPGALSVEDENKISQIFKECVDNLFASPIKSTLDLGLIDAEKITNLACFMKHCHQRMPFSIKIDPYAKIFEVNCQRFISLLEIEKIPEEEKELACTGGFTWEYIQGQNALSPEECNYLTHMTRWVFFSNDEICEKANCQAFQNCIEYLCRETDFTGKASSKYKKIITNPCEDQRFIKYKDAVLSFIQNSMKNIWEIIENHPIKEAKKKLVITSHSVHRVLSKALMRRTVEQLEQIFENRDFTVSEMCSVQFCKKLNHFVCNFNQSTFLQWKSYIENLFCLQYHSMHNAKITSWNFLQITYKTLKSYFCKSTEENLSFSAYEIHITQLHYAILLFFLDWINILSLDGFSQPNQFLLMNTLLSDVSIKNICTGVLTYFHPHSDFIHNFMHVPNSKKKIRRLTTQHSYVIGINRIFISIFNEKENDLPPSLRRSRTLKKFSKFRMHFMLEDLEIKTVQISKTLFHFLRCTSQDYLTFNGEQTMHFWFEKYFDLCEFQERRWERKHLSSLDMDAFSLDVVSC